MESQPALRISTGTSTTRHQSGKLSPRSPEEPSTAAVWTDKALCSAKLWRHLLSVTAKAWRPWALVHPHSIPNTPPYSVPSAPRGPSSTTSLSTWPAQQAGRTYQLCCNSTSREAQGQPGMGLRTMRNSNHDSHTESVTEPLLSHPGNEEIRVKIQVSSKVL